MRSGGFLLAELLDEARRRVADLGTLALPVGKALGLKAEPFLALGRFGIVETDALNEAAVARALRIRDHQIKKRTLFGAAACQSDHNHGKALKMRKGRDFTLVFGCSASVSVVAIRQATPTQEAPEPVFASVTP